MPALILTFLFGLFPDGSGDVIDEFYTRITHVDDLPDMKRTRAIPKSGGWRAGLFSESKYGWRPGQCTLYGPGVADALAQRLGPPLQLDMLGEVQTGYMWRRKDNPHRGILIVVHPTGRGALLKMWFMNDKPEGKEIGRLNQNKVYAWFHGLVDPR